MLPIPGWRKRPGRLEAPDGRLCLLEQHRLVGRRENGASGLHVIVGGVRVPRLEHRGRRPKGRVVEDCSVNVRRGRQEGKRQRQREREAPRPLKR